MVDVKFIKKFKQIIPLEQLKETASLDGMLVIKKGSRLSVQPVEKKHYEVCVGLGQ